MTISRGSHHRHLVPRWRPWRLTAALGELASSAPGRSNEIIIQRSARSLESLAFAFRKSPTVHRASDLVGAALAIGERPVAAVEAANFLLQHVKDGTPQSDAAGLLLEPDRRRFELVYKEPATDDLGTGAKLRITKLKRILRNEPRNAVRWVDLAREYIILGQGNQARRSMDIALHLDQNNRFILRSAAKLFEHQGDLVRAQSILDSASRTRFDPWLVASAVAIADLRGATSRHIRIAREMSSGETVTGLPLAEVAGAMSMVEWRHGSDRRARQLARAALVLPTDNVLAQFEWAREKGFYDIVSESGEATPRKYEADSRHFAAVLKWGDAIEQARLWLHDEPFSVEAAMHGSWAAAQADLYDVSEDFARAGRSANLADVGLANNYAWALAQRGRLHEALEELRRASYLDTSPRLEAFLLATQGLVLFRLGHTSAGRRNYLAAYEALIRLDSRDDAAMALIILVEEEMRAGTDQVAVAMVRAERTVRGVESAAVRDRWNRLQQLVDVDR